MEKLKALINYFTPFERGLWLSSIVLILASFFLFDGTNYPALVASLLGATSLIFIAKGNPIGQVIIVIFSMIYSYIAYTYAYYGELITYVCMTLPMAIFALISWLRHPFDGNAAEVKVHKMTPIEIVVMVVVVILVTIVFYFILGALNTANLIPSTLSVTTSFLGAYLIFMRSTYYGIGYAFNDIVIIVLWVLATMENIAYISMVVCFVVFLVNDLYGFYNWKRMEKRQKQLSES